MKIPKTQKITSRSSSITNAFIQAIVPTRKWTAEEEAVALDLLGVKRPALTCVYCAADTSEWDHLFPLVRNKKPTGYIHEIRNLVPSCGRCNHSKSGADGETWFGSPTAANSPTARKLDGNEERLRRLREFVAWGGLGPVDFKDLVDPKDLVAYWRTLDDLQKDMAAAQLLADQLKPVIQASLDRRLHCGSAGQDSVWVELKATTVLDLIDSARPMPETT